MELLVEDSNNPYGVHPRLWRWDPVTDGPAFSSFLDSSGLPQEAQQRLRSFTPRVLGQAPRPDELQRTTGLVIGKVQSGKTNSFLALAALASDNGYSLIIILSGTKNLLKNQTYRQVVKRLSRLHRSWKAVDFDPDVDQASFEARLGAAMSQLSPRTLVVTILKRTRDADQPQGIDALASFVETSDYADRLASQPVLIIDDEADEASLDNSANARRRGRARSNTPTHRAINRLRNAFGNHLFVQYTATPQANLLVELNDELAPDFCELLHPGEGYCGASEFFPDTERYFREIPADDVQAVASASQAPPATLLEAFNCFYVGAALEDLRGNELGPQTRTMLVHPEQTRASHATAHTWVAARRAFLLDVVREAIARPTAPHSRDLEELVKESLQELAKTIDVRGVEARDLFPHLHDRLEETEVRVVNSDRQVAQEVDWDEELCWIFIGGNVLQRGFAMQGLTVTWMSRGAGDGQVDVLMQRGRWFGYRQSFLPFCRVWMQRVVHDDFYALFADHESALWRSLDGHLQNGRSLSDWSRVFWLDTNPALRLCRRSSQWFRLREQPEWATQLWIPGEHDREAIEAAARNAAAVDTLLHGVREWEPGTRPPGAASYPSREHDYAVLTLAEVQPFIEEYTFFDVNVADHAVVRDAIAVLLADDPASRCAVVNMRPNALDYVRRQRGDESRIEQLQAGFSRGGLPPTDPRFYAGDRAYRAGGEGLSHVSEELLTIQIHRPRIERLHDTADLTAPNGYLEGGCPLLAVYLPQSVQRYRREARGDRS